MKLIKLTRNKYAIVDDDDFDKLNRYKWQCNYYGYAKRGIWDRGTNNNKQVLMHREIMGVLDRKDIEIDHINKNTLDNRKCNLRFCSHQENIMGKSGHYKNNKSSRYKGVYYRKDRRVWIVEIKYNYKKVYVGRIS